MGRDLTVTAVIAWSLSSIARSVSVCTTVLCLLPSRARASLRQLQRRCRAQGLSRQQIFVTFQSQAVSLRGACTTQVVGNVR